MKSFSLSNKNNIMTCIVVIIAVGLILWLTLKPSDNKQCPKNKIVVPIGNGQSVALTKEEYHKLMKEGYHKLMQEGYHKLMQEEYAREHYRGREGFYVSGQDYIPSVQTENEYSPMLSLYKPKEQSRIIPEPTPGPAMPVPIPGIGNGGMMTGGTGPVEGYGNVFLDNFDAPSVDPALEKHRQELTGISPFFLNNGRIMNGEAI